MSYDIDIRVDHPDGYTSNFEVGNMTYNVHAMMVAASTVSFSDLHDMRCVDATPILGHAWREMKRRPAHYRQFQADNGWGTLDKFMPHLTRFYVIATRLVNGHVPAARAPLTELVCVDRHRPAALQRVAFRAHDAGVPLQAHPSHAPHCTPSHRKCKRGSTR